MSYLVIARKWRPRRFDDILGQPHITQPLTNALASGRIAHAFLFTGARGVGKTSAARILARALCCTRADRPTPEPCGECAPCIEIAEGRATDVFEIDAASNTGVANVREIIDNVRYLPSSARFKIYIIDEVHMLSTGAFNALLKTLEEPPSHVKFILATTDVHKVPVTILSRCQRYDFRRIALTAIADRLSQILRDEGIQHDPSALTLVARESEGSMRDSQSLLEQVLTYAGGRPLEAHLVREALGIADHEILDRAARSLVERHPADVFEVVREVYDRGLDLKRFGNGLVEHLRDLLVARIARDPEKMLDRPRDEIDDLVRRAKPLDPVDLERIFQELCRVVETVGESSFPRFSLEVGLASLAETPPRVALSSLVDKLERLELEVERAPRSISLDSRRSELRGREQRNPPTPLRQAQGRPEQTVSPEAPASREDGVAEPVRRDEAVEAPPSKVEPVRAEAREPQRVRDQEMPSGSPSFSAFVEIVKKRRPTLSGSLSQVRPLVFQPGAVRLGAETRFDQGTLSTPEVRSYLEEILSQHFGSKTVLEVVRLDAPTESKKTLPMTIEEQSAAKRRAREDDKSREARRHPAVRKIEEVFGAEIVAVRPLEDAIEELGDDDERPERSKGSEPDDEVEA
ncbi:MAG: DNA polymerase III subunit gamma/tau [Deltaproteobacteria bacterium]|nr:DNA polymerase III subunit gamma/tau [Deltaproteobacteria bacterium]